MTQQRTSHGARRAALRRGIRSRLCDERGSTLPLIAAYAALAAALILVVSAATSLYLERKRLLTVADGAALAGAEAWSFAEGAGGAPVQFDHVALRAAVDDYLADADAAAGFAGFALTHVATDDDRGVTVTLHAVWRGPGVADLIPVEVPLDVTGTARSIIR